jgi:hypothetical protein
LLGQHTGQASGFRITGMRLWISAQSSFGVVVTIAKVRTHSSAGKRQFSHKPASTMMPRSASAKGCFPTAVFFRVFRDDSGRGGFLGWLDYVLRPPFA